jgi:hypothetical protein
MANFNPQRNIGADFVNQIFGTVINSFEQAKEAKSRRSQDTFKLFFDTFAADPTNPATLNLVSRGLDGMERTPENSLHVDILETSVDAEIDKNAKFKQAMVGLDPNFVRTAEKMIASGDLKGAVDLANKQGNTLVELNEIYPKRFSDTKSLQKSLNSVQNFLGNFEDFSISDGEVSELEWQHMFTENPQAVNRETKNVVAKEKAETDEQEKFKKNKRNRIDEIMEGINSRFENRGNPNEGESKSLLTLAKDYLVFGGSVEEIGNVPEDILTEATAQAQAELNPPKIEATVGADPTKTPDEIADSILDFLNKQKTQPADTTNVNK